MISQHGQQCQAIFARAIDTIERSVPSFPVMKVREVVRMLEEDGWYLVRTRGSHHQYKHPTKKGLVTIPGNRNDDLAHGTLNSILKQAGLKR
jgi:predicted RNA binding protein YcfA (HicA-like mRNA interferase family)